MNLNPENKMITQYRSLDRFNSDIQFIYLFSNYLKFSYIL